MAEVGPREPESQEEPRETVPVVLALPTPLGMGKPERGHRPIVSAADHRDGPSPIPEPKVYSILVRLLIGGAVDICATSNSAWIARRAPSRVVFALHCRTARGYS